MKASNLAASTLRYTAAHELIARWPDLTGGCAPETGHLADSMLEGCMPCCALAGSRLKACWRSFSCRLCVCLCVLERSWRPLEPNKSALESLLAALENLLECSWISPGRVHRILCTGVFRPLRLACRCTQDSVYSILTSHAVYTGSCVQRMGPATGRSWGRVIEGGSRVGGDLRESIPKGIDVGLCEALVKSKQPGRIHASLHGSTRADARGPDTFRYRLP